MRKKHLPLLLVPFLLLLGLAPMLAGSGPFYQAGRSDPDYAYLLNSLALRTGGSPGHWDHPGSTLQLFGAGVLLAGAPFRADAADLVVRDPESWLRAITIALALLCAVILAAAGRLVEQHTGSLVAAVAAQAFPFLSRVAWDAVPRLSPDLLATALGFFLLAAALPSKRKARARWAGACAGLLLATKVTGAPLLAAPLWWLRRDKRAIAAFLAAALGAACVTVLAAVRGDAGPFAAYFTGWIFRLVTRTGMYGAGAAGAPSPLEYAGGLVSLVRECPLFFLALLSLPLAARRLPRETRAVAYALLGVFALQALLVAKHPAARYLLPASPALGIALGLCLAKVKKATVGLTAWCTLAMLAQPLWFLAGGEAGARAARLEEKARLIRESGCRVLPYYWASDQAFALAFASYWSKDRFTAELSRAYPSFRLFDPGSGNTLGFNREALGPLPPGPLCLRGDLAALNPAGYQGRRPRLLALDVSDALVLLEP